jgi:ribosomal-protein-alanine N-acetyltransferase
VPPDSLFDTLPPIVTRRLRLGPIDLRTARKIALRLAPESIPWHLLAELPETSSTSAESNLMVEPFSVHHLPPWRVRSVDNREVIGACIFLTWSLPDARAELACVLAPDLDADVALELLHALIDFGFATVELNRIEVRCEASDARMAALYEAAGMRPEGILRQQVVAHDRFHDMKIHSILRSEYSAT